MKDIKIDYNDEPVELDIKRCNLPIVLKTICPHCNQEVTKDLSGDHLSYPKINGPFDVYFYHYYEEQDEDHEFYKSMIMKVTLEEE